MLPVTHGVESTKNHIVAYSYLMVISSLLPAFFGAAIIYSIGATLLGGYFILLAYQTRKSSETRDAMKLFGYSIVYLFFLFALLVVDATILA